LGDILDITGLIQFDYGEFQMMPRDDLDLLLEGVETEVVPAAIELSAAYPNPFNPSTTISYTIPATLSGVDINLSIYNVTGQLVAELVDGPRGAGEHAVVWNAINGQGQGVASGVYFYRFRAERSGQTLQLDHQKLLYLK
jgi:flagellar hook assembly protein FlgD